MSILLILLTIFTSLGTFASSSEKELLKKCGARDLDVCLVLTAQFLRASRFGDAFAMGDALCKKDVLKGCTYAGTVALVLGKAKEGFDLLSKACDGFEPFACQSLADIAKKNREDKMRYMYQKRACYNGLSESCSNLNKPTNFYSTKGQEFLTGILSDCEVTNSPSCKAQLENLKQCPSPLLKEDCFFIPGDLSIVFRAKLIQDVMKLKLLNIFATQKIFKDKNKRFTYDFSQFPKESSKYVFGFQVACTKKYEDKKAQSTSLGVDPKAFNFSNHTKQSIMAIFKKEKADDCYDPILGFEAYAAGKIDPLNPTQLDVWKISRAGDIIQIQNGLP